MAKFYPITAENRSIKEGSVYLNGYGMYIDNDNGKTVAALQTDGLSIYNEDGMKIEKDGEGLVLKQDLRIIKDY